MKKMSFVQAMLDYFGKAKGDQEGTAGSFMAEIKALTDEDRAWFKANLPSVGYEIV